MRCAPSFVVLFASLTAPVLAQDTPERGPDRPGARFDIGFGVAGGKFRFENDGPGLRDRTDAGMFRLDFEATSRAGFGGGVRFEGTNSDDDLFEGTGFAASEAKHGSVFAHFTYRLQEHRFAMPMRVGLLYDGLVLEENITPTNLTEDKVKYRSFGPYFEIEPEVVLTRSRSTQWSLYGLLGFGFGGTEIDVDNDPRDYQSFTSFFGVEFGTRIRFSAVEIGIAYVGRWQTMDTSDPELGPGGSLVALGYDGEFQGLMATFAVIF